MGGEGGGGGRGGIVHLIVNNFGKSNAKQKVSSKYVKPYGKRGVKRDGLIQLQITSLESKGGVRTNTGLCESVGKRKLSPAESDSPGAKMRNFDINL